MQRRQPSAQEVAADLSAAAVGRGEKTLEEHELYVEALFAGINVPPPGRDNPQNLAIALGVVLTAAVGGLIALFAVGQDAPGHHAATSSVSMAARIEGAVKLARQAYMDTTLVTRSERRQAAAVTGGTCQRPIPGQTLYDDAYSCNTWESVRLPLPPGLHLPPQPPEDYTVPWRVTLDEDLCWHATATDFTTGPLGTPPMRGCLRR